VDRERRQLSNWDPGNLWSDIPELVWRMALLSDDVEAGSVGFDVAVRRISAGPHTRVEDALRLLRGLLGSWQVLPPAARSACGYYAAAALLSPGVVAAAENVLAHPHWELPWRGLAAAVAEPARSVCLSLAETGRVRDGSP
jgi:hypothetical protein